MPTRLFDKDVVWLIRKRFLIQEDLEDFYNSLRKDPRTGDVVQGTGGVRKTRLASATKGKRGGFRVCYYFYDSEGLLYMLQIYAKNAQEDISERDRKSFKEFTNAIKKH